MSYPINLNLTGKKCLIVGGGEVAGRKAASLIEAGAAVTLIAPSIGTSLKNLARDGKITWINDVYESGMAKGYFLIIAATDDDEANVLVIKEAKNFGALVNAPANPTLSDFTVPAAIKRGNLTVAVSTEGISPAFSKILKEEISKFLPNNIDKWLNILKNVRNDIKEKYKTGRERERFWRTALNSEIFELLKAGKLKEAEEELRHGFFGDGTKP